MADAMDTTMDVTQLDETTLMGNQYKQEATLEDLRRVRGSVRRHFLKLEKELGDFLEEPTPSVENVAKKFREFVQVFDDLNKRNEAIVILVGTSRLPEEEADAEYAELSSVRVKGEEMKRMVDKFCAPYIEKVTGTPPRGEVSGRKVRLPEVILEKFNGDLMDWLRFWGQFGKIDEDSTLADSDKFYYLLQSLEKNSDAYEVVASFPKGDTHYRQAVDALKKRFGNQDMLLQTYVTQLLAVIIQNIRDKEKTPFRTFVVKVESYIRALDTMNLATLDPATLLYSLIEASLPEDVQQNWARSGDSSQIGNGKNRLDSLLAFLGKEVELRQRNEITKNFTTSLKNAGMEKKMTPRQLGEQVGKPRLNRPATTMAFHAGESKACIFCGRNNHLSKDCRKAKNYMKVEEKMKILREKGRCFICMLPHRASDCRNKEKIRCDECGKPHLLVLCREAEKKQATTLLSMEPPAAKRRRVGDVATTMSNQVSTGDVCLQTLKIKLMNGNQERVVRVFLDPGSARSYILKQTAKKLELTPTSEESVIHALFGGHLTMPKNHKIYDLTLQGLQKGVTSTFKVRDQDIICSTIKRIDEVYDDLWLELEDKGITLTDIGNSNDDIEMLIGADIYGKLLTGKVKELSNNLHAIETIFGWTLIGEVGHAAKRECREFCMGNNEILISNIWELDCLGIKDPVEVVSEKERNEKAKVQFLKNVCRNEDGRYVIRLPWKEGHPVLPTNREVATKRLETTSKRLLKANMLSTYNKLFESWENEGFIERVMGTPSLLHYLPHRAVIKKESVTTPVRPVFDASCKGKGTVSLNDCLHKGESFIHKIPDVLLKFRERKIGFVSDIRKAFQTIEVHVDDRDALRFLWWESKSMDNLKEYRHVRVPFGANCSPFILGAIIEHHLGSVKPEHSEIAKRLWGSLYVDNCCSSENSYEEYEHFREMSVGILADAKMDLRMWYNSVDDVKNEETRTISVLGLKWDRKNDELYLDLQKITEPDRITKKTVLSTISKIFDPVGFSSPGVLGMKLLLQTAWASKLKWDEPLPKGEGERFLKWFEELKYLGEIRIPRLISGGRSDHKTWELHTFTDGSKYAYGAICFLRTSEGENVSVQLLLAKSRVAPLKKISIPRMELLGCLIGARIMQGVLSALDVGNVKKYMWTDSTTALAWIRRDNQWGTFVGNRTSEINKLTSKEDWNHVPGVANPADLPSRGCSPKELRDSMWWKGPSWLYKPKTEWPIAVLEYNEDEIGGELKISVTKPIVFSNVCLDFGKQYTFASLVRIQAWVRRFCYNVSHKDKTTGPLKRRELDRAEIDLVLQIQGEIFGPDLGKERLKTLETFVDELGVIRVKTRLTYLDEDESFKFPVVLPGEHAVVKQLIWDYHIGYCHAGVGFLLTKIRQKYWILKARQSVKKITSRCYKCRKLTAKSPVTQSAPLPLDRLKAADVFEVTGVDLAGPFLMKNGKKVWLVLYTCAVYRAVHLDLINSLSTSAFIKSLGRFVEKFRRPVTIYSDNGTNFRGADNLFRAIDWNLVQEKTFVQRIEWKFNPPTAAWWGGWWERLIRVVKDLLRKEIGNALLGYQEFEMVVRKIEDIMNERPLTYISEDPNDLEPLTPAHFLRPLGLVKFPEMEHVGGEQLRIRYKKMDAIQKSLKIRFKKDYISLLINRNPKKVTRPLTVGEIVVVGQDNRKRGLWPLGRILEMKPGADGITRVAKVKTREGVLVRPVQRLHPLEADSNDPVCKMGESKTRFGRVIKRPHRFQ